MNHNIPDLLYLIFYFDKELRNKIFYDENSYKSFIGLKKKNPNFRLISILEYNYYQEKYTI